ERQPRIADQRVLGDDVLVQIGRIQRRVDDRLARRHLHAEVRARETAADSEDYVGFLQEVVYRLRHRTAAGAERERMVFRKGALALEAGGDRCREQLGEPLKLRPGLGVMNPLPRIDHRPLRLYQYLGDLFRRLWIGATLRTGNGLVVQRLRYLFVEDVGGDLDHCRPGAPVAQHREGEIGRAHVWTPVT